MKLATIRKYAMSLPNVTEEPHHHFGSFRVNKRIFVTVPPGEEYLHIFVPEQVREEALELYPQFVEKLWWGGKVVGIKVSLEGAKPAVARQLVKRAWTHRSPVALQRRQRR
jgi:hypothetical protein